MLHHLVVKMGDTANASREHHAHLVEIGVHRREMGTFYRLCSSYNVVLRIQIVLAHVFAVKIIQWIVILDFSGEMSLVIGAIEMGNRTDSIAAID